MYITCIPSETKVGEDIKLKLVRHNLSLNSVCFIALRQAWHHLKTSSAVVGPTESYRSWTSVPTESYRSVSPLSQTDPGPVSQISQTDPGPVSPLSQTDPGPVVKPLH